jgi:hypothetical protein
VIEKTLNSDWTYLVWSNNMIANYSAIDQWCYKNWGPNGVLWREGEIGWLVKNYDQALILILTWDC